MKINKLFHWLYAFLMFLPVLALAPSLFYFAFNQQSQNYTDVQVNETYEYETNEVNSVDDLVEGNIYKLTIPEQPSTGVAYITNTDMIRLYSGGLSVITAYEEELKMNYNSTYDRIYIYQGANYTTITVLTADYINYPLTTYFVYFENGIDNNQIDKISASDYLGEKNVEVVRSEQSPMNIFYTAVNYVFDMPVFSWSKVSFLALPITYITGLFGMASTNVVNYYLSYWLAISIVYLVFDLVMYVPMLVHRWIDKGMLE